MVEPRGGPRLILIGLDLGDGGLVEAWAGDGSLPNLARLLERGELAPLSSTADTLHVSAWPSLYTGAHPGEHGVYFTFQPAPGCQGHRRFQEGLYGVPTFWNRLAGSGVDSAILDAPYTHPEPATGPGRVSQIFDWGVWAQYLGPRSTPSDLLGRLRRAVGRYPLGMEAHQVGLDAIDAGELGPRLAGAARLRTEAALWLLHEAPADLFMVVYGETHPAGHYGWPRDGGKPPPGGEGPGWTCLREVYREIDRGIGRLLGAAPPDATVCVFSPDRVVDNYGAWHLLPEALRRWGYLAEPGTGGEGGAGPDDRPATGARPGLLRRVRDLLPRDLRKSVARRLPTGLRDRLARNVDTALIDWSRTRAYALPTDLEGCIRINLLGREPRGIVPPEAYAGLVNELASRLTGLEDPGSGRRLVREVVRVRERYPGTRVDHLPDLVVLWEDAGQAGEMRAPDLDRIAGVSPDRRPGTHGVPGFRITAGSGRGAWAGVGDVRDFAGAAIETLARKG